MKTDHFVDVFVDDRLSPIDACYQLVEAAEDLRAGVKAVYHNRWIAAAPRDDAHQLHKALINTPPDWPGVVTARTRAAA